MSVFSAAELEFFDRNGYVILHDAVPPENCAAVVDAIWEFLEMNPNDPNDWYREPRGGGMVEMYHHPAMWANRQYPRVHAAFAQLLGTEQLWVSQDRVGMKPPRHPDHPAHDHKGFTHWDLDTSQPLSPKLRVQGVLCLTDTDESMGGFQCVPGFHRDLDKWIAAQPENRNPRAPDLDALPEGMKVTPIPAQRGDLIIWNNLLAHGNGHNTSDRPRLAQYITMHTVPPSGPSREEARAYRLDIYQNRKCGLSKSADPNAGDPRHKEQNGPLAELSPLGRKLVGLDDWNED